MKIYKLVLFAFCCFFFLGCSQKTITKSSPVFISFRTDNLRFEDYGFLAFGKDFVRLDVYHTGVVLMNLNIDKQYTCMNSSCLSNKEFLSKYLCDKLPNKSLFEMLSSNKLENINLKDIGYMHFRQSLQECDFVYEVDGYDILIQSPKFYLQIRGIDDQ